MTGRDQGPRSVPRSEWTYTLPAKEAAPRLGVLPPTVYKMHRRGELTARIERGRGRLLFSGEQIDQLLAEREEEERQAAEQDALLRPLRKLAHSRALSDLRERHPDEFRMLYVQRLAALVEVQEEQSPPVRPGGLSSHLQEGHQQ